MPDLTDQILRQSPIVVPAGCQTGGAEKTDGPGVLLSVDNAVSTAEVALRNGKLASLAKALDKTCGLAVPGQGRFTRNEDFAIYWCGPDKWYITADQMKEGQLLQHLAPAMSGVASLVDQSHGRLKFNISGRNARDLLCKATQVDLHPRSFKPGDCAVTQMAHIATHLSLDADDTFKISLYRSFAEHFWEWLLEMSLEFGYQATSK